VAVERSVKEAPKNTRSINTYSEKKIQDERRGRKRKVILDPSYRYKISPKQVAINVYGESKLINGIKIEMYIPLVKWLANKVAAYLPPHVDREELLSEGFCGLMEAAYKYNSDKGRFETFARNRICGSMQDWLRSIDRLPRSAREAMRKIEAAESSLTAEMGRAPTIYEVAGKMGVSPSSVAKRKSRLGMEHQSSTVMSKKQTYTADVAEMSEKDSFAMEDGGLEPDNPFKNPDYLRATIDEIAIAVHSLSDKDKIICLMSIFEGCDTPDIVTLLSVSQSRVKQAKDALAVMARLKVF
jgi:RNA polymerase sigma factor for flagellar operon FliA